MSNVYVLMAPGFEEMELVITVDMLRRASLPVQTVSLADRVEPVTGSRGIAMLPDLPFDRLAAADCRALVLPGGLEGTRHLANDARVLDLIRRLAANDVWLAAICAAPTVLVAAGVAQGRRMTSHPAMREKMAGVIYAEDRVVIDGRFITSRAAGTTFEFAAALIEALGAPTSVAEVNRGVLARLEK